jgi:hypothetical protein
MQKHRILTYSNINRDTIDMILKELIDNGAVIRGQNPWDIVTYHHGVILNAEWDEAASTLAVSVTHSNWYVPRDTVCNYIDSLMRDIQKLESL